MLLRWGRSFSRSRSIEDVKPVVAPAECLLAPIAQLSCGEEHTLARDALGNVYVWGRTREGQAGRFDAVAQAEPMLYRPLLHECVIHVCCAYNSCYAVSASGLAFVWGEAWRKAPREDGPDAGLISGYGRSVAALREADMRMLRRSLRSYMMAADARGADGAEAVEPAEVADEELGSSMRRELLPEPKLLHVPATVSAGYRFYVLVLDSGGVMAAGINDRFQLGMGDRVQRPTAAEVSGFGGSRIASVACGQQHTLALSEEGLVFSWGFGAFGQLGHGTHADVSMPKRVDALASAGAAISASAGQFNSAVIVRGEGVGDASHDTRSTSTSSTAGAEAAPTPAPAPASATRQKQTLFTFGHAEAGQLGLSACAVLDSLNLRHSAFRRGLGDADDEQLVGVLGNVVRPTPVALIPEWGAPLAVDCGTLHTLLLTTRRRVFSFGDGSNGALGHGHKMYAMLPTEVQELRLRQVGVIAAGGRISTAAETGGGGALTSDLKALRGRSIASDCLVVVGGIEFALHRAIVAARCPRLLVWLLMHERFGARGPLTLTRVKPVVFEHLVNWMYTDSLHLTDAYLRFQLGQFARRLRVWRLHRLVAAIADRLHDETRNTPIKRPGLAPAFVPTSAASAAAAAATASPASYDAGALLVASGLPLDMLQLLQSEDCADVELIATDGLLRVSKAVLSARSDFFRRRLLGDFFAEAAHRRATDEERCDLRAYDVDLQLLKLVVCHCYTGHLTPRQAMRKVQVAAVAGDAEIDASAAADANADDDEDDDFPWEILPALLSIAGALLLEPLKLLCEAMLIACIDTDNCEAMQSLAASCYAPRLEAAAAAAKSIQAAADVQAAQSGADAAHC